MIFKKISTYCFFLILSWLCCSIPTHAQQLIVDSLLKESKAYLKDDSLKVNLLYKISYAYYRIHPDSTILYAKKGLTISESLNDFKAEGIRLIGLAYWVKGEYTTSLKYLQEAIQQSQIEGNMIEYSRSLNSIGLVYYRENSLEKALEYFQKGLEIDRKMENQHSIAIKLNNIGMIYDLQGHHKKALTYLDSSLNLSEKHGFREFIPLTLYFISSANYNLKNYSKSEETSKRGIIEAQKIGSDREIVQHSLILGQVFQIYQKGEISKNYFENALLLAQKMHEKEHIRNAYRGLYNYYKLEKKHQKALEYFELAHLIEDSLFTENKNKEFKNLELKFDLKSKEAQINLLKNNQSLQDEKERNQRLVIYLLILMIFLLLIFLFLISSFRNKEKRNNELLTTQKIELEHKNKEIEEKQEELIQQSVQLQSLNRTKDQLFTVISHDFRSPLISVKNIIQFLDSESLSKSEFEEIKAELEQQLDLTLSTMDNLLIWSKNQITGNQEHTPIRLDIYKIIEDSKSLYSGQIDKKGLNVHNEVVPQTYIWADVQQISVVIRNLISNAIKFSFENKNIWIQSQIQGEYIWIQVKDEGIGMTEEQVKNLKDNDKTKSTLGTNMEKGTGLGLLLFKQFVLKNGGEYCIKSKKGEGSTFAFKISLSK
jgi:signal transduction histidine kinase/tetratricopeptide (TPR) repeat protein